MKRKREKYGQIGLPPDEWFAEGGNLKARKKRVRGKRPRRAEQAAAAAVGLYGLSAQAIHRLREVKP